MNIFSKTFIKTPPPFMGRAGVGLLFLLLFLTSCTKERLFPVASGRPYDVLVVMDDDAWERPAGRALYDALFMDVPGLPQAEPAFNISQCAPKKMDQILNLARNVVEIKIAPQIYTHTKLKFSRNKFALEQIWVTLQAPSEDSLQVYCKKYRNYIVNFLTKTEMNRQIVKMREKNSEKVAQLTKDMFGCSLLAPEELTCWKEGEKFYWTSNNTASGLVNICMYSYPYTGPDTFNKFYVLHKRDSVMHFNIPGSEPDMYMKTDTLYTDCRPISVHGQFAYESRGLWYMNNAGMGGPFVSHSRVDTTRNEVIVVEGFAYAPEKMKRGLIRRLEASLYTLMLPGELNTPEAIETDVEEDVKTPENESRES